MPPQALECELAMTPQERRLRDHGARICARDIEAVKKAILEHKPVTLYPALGQDRGEFEMYCNAVEDLARQKLGQGHA